jgi:hypothetical protein
MDDRTEERILEKARYIVDAIEVLAAQRDELSFDEYEHSRTDRDIVEREFETAIEVDLTARGRKVAGEAMGEG